MCRVRCSLSSASSRCLSNRVYGGSAGIVVYLLLQNTPLARLCGHAHLKSGGIRLVTFPRHSTRPLLSIGRNDTWGRQMKHLKGGAGVAVNSL